jgi:5-methylcytosine-specific restriction endonuclease McrA
LTYFNHKCAYCERGEDLRQDHFVPLTKNGEYTHNNIVPACNKCNASKNNSDFFSWYRNKPFYSKDRERRILRYLNYSTNTHVQQIALLALF